MEEKLSIHCKINAKSNALKLYSYQTPANMIRRGYPLPGRYSPEYLIPKQHLEFREPKNAGRAVDEAWMGGIAENH